MNSMGVMIKFIGKEAPVFYSMDRINVDTIDDVNASFEESTKFFELYLSNKNVYINLDRVEYIEFIYE